MPNPDKATGEKKLVLLCAKLELIDRRLARAKHLMKRNHDKAMKARVVSVRDRYEHLANRYAAQIDPVTTKRRRMQATVNAVRQNIRAAKRLEEAAQEHPSLAAQEKARQQEKASREAAVLASLSPKDARKRLQAVEHEENRKAKALRQTRQRLATAGLEPDERLANAKREIEVVGIGKAAHGYVSGLSSVLRQTAERSPERVAAWDRFDRICEVACAGIIRSPTYDAPVSGGVDSSRNNNARVDAGVAMTQLSRHVGMDGWGLLFAVIYMRKSFVELSDQGAGTRHEVAARFRAALDGAAQFWGLTEQQIMGRETRRILTYFDEEAGQARRRA